MASSFLELTIAGDKPKALFIPTQAILSYEEMPEGKNPNVPNGKAFLRYDFGEGLSFAVVTQDLPYLKQEIGTEGFITLHLADDAEMLLQDRLIVAVQEKEDEGVELTQLSVAMGGQVGSLFVKEKFAEIKAQRSA